MSNEKHCTSCGTKVVTGQPFCPQCGMDLTPLWAARDAEPSRISAQMPAPSIQPDAGQKPWPFSAELLADRLAAGSYVGRPAAEALLAEAAATGRSFVDLLLDRHQMTPEALRDAMARIFGMPTVDPGAAEIDPALVQGFPAEHARRSILLPLHREGDRLLVAVYDPTAAAAIRAVRRAIGLTVDMRLASRPELEPVVHAFFSSRIVALLPSGETIDYPLLRDEVRIGRAPQNDLVLPDPAVGSTHAIVRARGTRFEIVDNGSRNGVFLNDARVEAPTLLAHNDVVKLGTCVLTFKMPVPDVAKESGGATQILSPGMLPSPSHLPKIAAPAASASQVPAPMPTLVASPAVYAPAPQRLSQDAQPADEPKKKKKKDKSAAEEDEKEKGRRISADRQKEYIATASRIISQVIGALATILLALAVSGQLPTSCGGTGGPVNSVAFAEMNAGQPYNVSGVVPIGDGRFLMCDNNFSEGMVEVAIGPDGVKTGELAVRQFTGLAPDAIDDMEGLTIVEEDGRRWIFATTSLYNDVKKKSGGAKQRPAGLLRISINPDGSLAAETVPGYREWVLQNRPELAAAADIIPDDGGLNVEGLAWDPKRRALLLGVRTPVVDGRPMIVPIRVKDLAGPWNTSNLEMLPPISLTLAGGGVHERGIRSIEWDDSRNAFLVVVGNSTSGPAGSKAAFELHTWDGGDDGATTLLKNLTFRERDREAAVEQMKPEGVTHATIGGKGALVFADDSGGYAVVWDEDPRLKN